MNYLFANLLVAWLHHHGLIHIRKNGEVGGVSKPSSKKITDHSKALHFLWDPFLLFVFHVCHAVLSVPCSLVVTCWVRTDLLALLCVVFSGVFVTFSYGVLGQVWYLTVSIPYLCLLPYFYI